jgi:hypothetical protein
MTGLAPVGITPGSSGYSAIHAAKSTTSPPLKLWARDPKGSEEIGREDGDSPE